MASRRSSGREPARQVQEPAHDVLAAEAFPMPAGDPRLHEERAHDVLAAEAFAMGAADPALHHGPVVLPEDPTGIAEAHDVLAAEEFAMPSGPPLHAADVLAPGRGASRVARIVAAAATGYVMLRALRRR